jgi:hypothetical protein
MTQEIESIKPALSVILDDGDFIINSTGPVGRAMSQAVLPLLASARRVTIITDGEMKVMKRNGTGQMANGKAVDEVPQAIKPALPAAPAGPDVQESFISDIETGKTGEIATGEAPSPLARSKPRIFQDAAAPPAPELAEAEMDRMLQEAAQAEQGAARAAEDQRFQRQQAIQNNEPVEEAPEQPRRRERNLAVNTSACGNCGGSGQSVRIDSTGSAIIDGNGQVMSGVCQVCSGSGQVKAWGRRPGRR